jgi:hypothetical protein
MKNNEYFLFYKQSNMSSYSSYNNWIFYGNFSSLAEVKQSIEETKNRTLASRNEYRVFKGIELEWEEKYTERIYTERILQSRELKDVED